MSQQDNPQQNLPKRKYMALPPLAALAGIFINPFASTVAPLVLYFIFRTSRTDVAKTALRTADLAFSIQLWIVLISLSLLLGISLNLVTTNETQQMMSLATVILLAVYVISLLYAAFQAFNGKSCQYFFSFKIAERVFDLVSKRNQPENNNQ